MEIVKPFRPRPACLGLGFDLVFRVLRCATPGFMFAAPPAGAVFFFGG